MSPTMLKISAVAFNDLQWSLRKSQERQSHKARNAKDSVRKHVTMTVMKATTVVRFASFHSGRNEMS